MNFITNSQRRPNMGFSIPQLNIPKTNQAVYSFERPRLSSAPSSPKKSALQAYARKGREPLPHGFSDQIIENEMLLQLDEVAIETINKLTELYSVGMVHYEPDVKHKYKYQYFSNKLQDMMLKPNVKETMIKELSPNKTPQDDKEIRRMRLENQVNRVNAEKEAFTLVKSHEDREKEIDKVLEGDLSSQKDKMKKRLAERKERSKSRAQSMTFSDNKSEANEEAIQDIEKELEGLPKIDTRGLDDIEEVDEARYSTPPRRRTKEGLMILYQKPRKSLKPVDPQEIKTERGTRRFSENKDNLLVSIANRRSLRALSFEKKDGLVPEINKNDWLIREGKSNGSKESQGEDKKEKANNGRINNQAEQQGENSIVSEESDSDSGSEEEINHKERITELRKVEENEERALIGEFMKKQGSKKNDLIKNIEEKYRKKIEVLEGDMEEEERVGAMWTKIMSKLAKDKEDELKKELEKFEKEQGEEVESYKASLQQEKILSLIN